MKKPKISLDMSKIQGLLVQHVEKIVLLVVVLVACWFVYQGYSIEGLAQNKTPSSLKESAQRATSHINRPTVWDEIVKTRSVPMDVPEKVTQGHKPADALAYRLPNAWNRSDFPKLSRRVDPKLFPPINLKVVPMVGPLAYYDPNPPQPGTGTGLATSTDDPLDLATLMEAELASEPSKPKPKPKKMVMDPATGMMVEAPKGGRNPRGRQPYPGMEGSEMLAPTAEGSMPGAMYDPSGSGMYGTGQAAMLNPESVLGFRPQGPTIARPTRCVTVMAVVPVERQIEEFENALESGLDYDPLRDQPRYLQFGVERADVTEDPFIDPATAKWEPLKVIASLAESANWAGYPEEVSDPNYIDPAYFDPNTRTAVNVLTHPAPPFMQRNLWDLLYHPDVPLPALQVTELGPDGRPIMPVVPGAEDPEISEDLPIAPITGPGMPGMMGGEGSYGSGAPGMMPGGGGGMRPQSRPQRGGMMGGAPGMYGSESGGSGMYGASGVATPTIAKYKLLRFNDMEVKQGRVYRYRVRLLVEDPNHPANPLAAPSIQSLDDPVRERVKALEADEAKRADKRRTFWRVSDWSEPSELVKLPDSESFFAKSVVAPPSSEVVPGKPRVPNKEHTATTLAVVWDDVKRVDVPAPLEVLRGSTVNFQADAQVIHPALASERKLTKYVFKTQAVVADISGGEVIPPLQRANDKPLNAPGELLIFDRFGKLQVRHETDDIEAMRRYTIPEPPKPTTTTPGMEGSTDPTMSGYDDLMNMGPGGRPPRRPRGSQP
ncbi:hypothetical protein Psta_3612 [Pirellula staleyi DSM 6068]|uniref:Uncharacterized protein n=1 Tax=Pirellula staleyi (strain ATCC 27377 / DSM 6068 / ICPB 4128) TaxID=530564 RepID=D2QZ81_PIRSD|nr:hypothetical protein [Pirellula staleyi]ADB18273.1 hypothetical protein Psta_3612 [Pirellula staleyi DSM 6068]